jgi:hypothetical protein
MAAIEKMVLSLSLAAALLAGANGLAQVAPSVQAASQEEREDAEDFAIANRLWAYLESGPLLSMPAGPDGRRGIRIEIDGTRVAITEDFLRAHGYSTRAQYEFKRYYLCRSALVVGTATRSVSALSEKGGAIFTKSRFVIDEVIEAGGGVRVGDAISFLQQGGEVNVAGNALTMSVQAQHLIESGNRYLVSLGKNIGRPNLYFPQDGVFVLNDGKLFPDRDAPPLITTAMPLEALKAEIARINRTSACL